MGTAKIFQTGAFGMEVHTTLKPHGGWGDPDSANPLTSASGFPYTAFGTTQESGTKEDESVTDSAFRAADRLVTLTTDQDLEFPNRFDGIGRLWAWMFGFENKPRMVSRFVVASAPAPALDGTSVYEDSAGNEYTFDRMSDARTLTNEPYVVLQFTRTSAYTGVTATGNLTKVTGLGPATIAYTKANANMFEHLYEVDKNGKGIRSLSSAEIAVLGTYYLAGDKKTDMATLAKRYTNYRVRYANAIATKCMVSASPADFMTVQSGYLGYKQERFNTGNVVGDAINFGMACDLVDSSNVIAHYQTRIFVAPAGSGLVEYGVTDYDLGFEIPLQKQQTTKTGVFIDTPYLEGKYDMSFNATLGRAEDQTWQTYRDELTPLKAKIQANFGEYEQEIFIKSCTVTGAGPDDGDVAAEPLEFKVNAVCGTHEFEDDIKHTETQNSPVLVRVVDTNPYNDMLSRDVAGALRP